MDFRLLGKLISLVLALMMVVGMMGMAFASGNTEGGDSVTTPGGTTEGGTTEGGTTEGESTTKDYDYPLTVTGLTTGDVVHFYQVIEWVGETTDKSDVTGWKAKAPFDTYLTKQKLIDILVGTPAVEDDPATTDVNEAKEAVPPTGITSEIAGELAKLASGDGTVKTAESATVTLENASSGMWMALVTPFDANTVYNPVFVSADYNKDAVGTVGMGDTYEGDTVAKKSTLVLTKEADTSPEDTNDDQKSTTTAVGDTVKFTVNTQIPAYGDVYDNPHFVLSDTLNALELKADANNACGYDVVVEGVPATYKDAEDNDQPSYTIAATKAGYTITFTEGYLKTLKTNVTNVKVKYSAIVTVDAVKAVNEEDNTVSIEYSHNPNDQDDYDVKKDTTQHYTFTLDASGMGEGQTVSGKKTSELVKIGLDANGQPIIDKTETSAITSTETWSGPLEGAVFGLFTDSEGKNPYYPKDKTTGEVSTTALTATTGADGRMTFAGLDAGTYYLKEISAPAGFVTNTTVHTVVITATTKSVKVTEWWNGSEWVSTKPTSGTAKEVTYDTDILESYTVTVDGNSVAEYQFKNEATANSTEINWEEAECVEHPFELPNVQGTELPSTGGIGTTLFYVIGACLVLGAGVLLVTKRKMAVK